MAGLVSLKDSVKVRVLELLPKRSDSLVVKQFLCNELTWVRFPFGAICVSH